MSDVVYNIFDKRVFDCLETHGFGHEPENHQFTLHNGQHAKKNSLAVQGNLLSCQFLENVGKCTYVDPEIKFMCQRVQNFLGTLLVFS